MWVVLAFWIAAVNQMQTQTTKEAANKIPFCIQFAFESRFGWNNKLIQFGNIYQPSPLLLYRNGSWRLYYFSNWVIYSCTFECWLNLFFNTRPNLQHNHWLAYEADKPLRRSQKVNGEIYKSEHLGVVPQEKHRTFCSWRQGRGERGEGLVSVAFSQCSFMLTRLTLNLIPAWPGQQRVQLNLVYQVSFKWWTLSYP